MSKAINKEYLISSLKDFNEKILSKIYAPIPKNKSVLDELDESDGNLTFNGNKIGLGDPGKSAYDIWIEQGNNGTQNEFLESLKGTQGDSGKDGRSIKSITTDSNNNVIVTFSDDTTQNIGSLNIDVSADFITSGGFGNLRYYNGHFQYYNTDSTWVDIATTLDNVLVVNMMPNPMRRIIGVYDHNIGHYKLKWKEPEDTVVDGQVICLVEKVVIRRKLGGVPANENDGDLVVEIERSEFGSYDKVWFIDGKISPNFGDTYYYKVFPMSTTGFYNTSTQNETGGILAKDYELYGFKLDQNESDPASMITYLNDNKSFRSAYMDYATNTFNYGDWLDAFFMKVRPCMLKYNGTVDYYLDPDNYDLKEDGTPSDVADVNYGGNAMMQFPKVYYKIVDNGDNTADIYISNKKLDEGFHYWTHIDANGNEIPYCYMPIYNGYNDGTRLRSLSNKIPMHSKTASQEVALALANNPTGDVIWYTDVFCDRSLVNNLLLLIGKSTNTQAVFGNGYCTGGSRDSNPRIKTGTMNTNGLFWGSNGSSMVGVKVFGMEHWWGNQWRRIAGWIEDKGTQKVKMTYGQSDGSTVDGYNTTGDGYITIPNATPSGTTGMYISKMVFDDHGLIPKTVSGSGTTYYTDGLYFNNSQVDYAFVGGCSDTKLLAGALYSYLSYEAYKTYWGAGAAISCKPLANNGGAS